MDIISTVVYIYVGLDVSGVLESYRHYFYCFLYLCRIGCQWGAGVLWTLFLLLSIFDYEGLEVRGVLESYGHYFYFCLYLTM